MLIIDVQEGEALDKVLRKYKRKFEKVGILKETRSRSQYRKPSAVKKEQLKKAISRERYYVREGLV